MRPCWWMGVFELTGTAVPWPGALHMSGLHTCRHGWTPSWSAFGFARPPCRKICPCSAEVAHHNAGNTMLMCRLLLVMGTAAAV